MDAVENITRQLPHPGNFAQPGVSKKCWDEAVVQFIGTYIIHVWMCVYVCVARRQKLVINKTQYGKRLYIRTACGYYGHT